MTTRSIESAVVMGLPTVLYQITLYLEPGDLLRLSRTCVLLNKLMGSSGFIWERVLHQYGCSVPPGTIMRRPRTRVIVDFTKECSTCGDETENLVLHELGIRLCDPCMETELVALPVQPPEFAYPRWEYGIGRCQCTSVVFRHDPPGSISATRRNPLDAYTYPATLYPQSTFYLGYEYPQYEYNWLHPDTQLLRLKTQQAAEEEVMSGRDRQGPSGPGRQNNNYNHNSGVEMPRAGPRRRTTTHGTGPTRQLRAQARARAEPYTRR